MDKKIYQTIESRTDEILYYIWDPIGVRESPEVRNEYRTYASRITSLLINGKSDIEIRRYLEHVRRNDMGLRSPFGKYNEINVTKMICTMYRFILRDMSDIKP